MNVREKQILKDQNSKFASLRTGETIRINGEYKLSDSEYLINMPFQMYLDAGYRSFSLPFRMPNYQISVNKELMTKFIGELKQNRKL